MPRIHTSRSVLLAAVAALALTAFPRAFQSSAGADHTAHLKAWDAHKTMTQSSPYRSMNWSYVGPTNVSGRTADVAAADHGTSRRLYAGTCCGGLWASDDLGETWQAVFDKEASTSIGAVAVAPSNPDIVWVGTGESNIFRSSYTGVGVYKSTDNAKTWQHMGLTDTGTVGRIVIHPTDPNVVYVASAGQEWKENEMRGLYKTTNGGRTWTQSLKISAKTGVNDVAMDPSDPNTLYAAAWERQRRKWNDPRVEPGFNESGIFKTTDAGKTWTRLTNGLPAANVTGRVGLAIAASNPKVVYAYYDNYTCDTQAVAGAPNPGGSAAACPILGTQVYRSNDKGATWTMVSGSTPEQARQVQRVGASYAWVFSNIRVDPTDENTVYILGLFVSVSHDGGKTFAQFFGPPSATPPAAGRGGGGGRNGIGGDNHAMWIDPKNPKFMLSGNDSGFRVTNDGGATWKRAELPNSTFFDIAYDMDKPFHVYGSIQDHGSYRAAIDLSNGVDGLKPLAWESAPGGEYSEHAIDPTNPNIVYFASNTGATRTDLSIPPPAGGRRGGGGAGAGAGTGAGREGAPPTGPQRTKNIRPPVAEGGDPLRMQVLAPIMLSPFDPNTVYLGAQYLFRSHDRGDTWEKLTPDLSYGDKAHLGDIPDQLVISIAESPKKKGVLYAATDDGRLHRSMDDGKTWTELTSKLPHRMWVAKVLASQYNEGTVYLAEQGRYDEDFGVYLYKSTDYGATWKSIAGNLPGGPMNMIREDPVTPGVLYAANDFGMYVSTNDGGRWDVLGGNLPSVDVMDFVIHPRDRVAVIATHGRGVWVLDVSKIGK